MGFRRYWGFDGANRECAWENRAVAFVGIWETWVSERETENQGQIMNKSWLGEIEIGEKLMGR